MTYFSTRILIFIFAVFFQVVLIHVVEAINIDSLKIELKNMSSDTGRLRILQDITNYYSSNELDSCKIYLTRTLTLSNKVNLPKEIAKNYILEGEFFRQKKDLKKADSLFFLSEHIYKKLSDDEGLFNANTSLGRTQVTLGEFDKALLYFEKSLEAAKKVSERKVAIANINLGIAYGVLGFYDKAFESYFEAMKFFEKSNDKKNKSKIYSSLGNLYVSYSMNNATINELDKAINYYKKALELDKSINDNHSIAFSLATLGQCYGRKNELDSALIFIKEAQRFASKTNDKELVCNFSGDMANVYVLQKKYKQALKLYKENLVYFESVNQKERIAGMKLNLGMTYNYLGDYKSGIQYYKEALDLANKFGYKRMKETLIKNLALTYVDIGDFENAYLMQRKRQFLRDTLVNEEREKTLLDLETKYETEKKEQEIVILNQEKQLQQTKVIQYLIGGIALAAILSTIMFFVVRQSRIRKKSNAILSTQKQQIQQQNQEIQKLRNAESHRTDNNYKRVLILLEEQANTSNNEVARMAINKGQSLILTSSYLHKMFKKNEQKEGEDFYIASFFTKFCNELTTLFFTHQEVQTQLLIDETIRLNKNTIQPVFLIVEELFTNTWKHAFKEQLHPQIKAFSSKSVAPKQPFACDLIFVYLLLL